MSDDTSPRLLYGGNPQIPKGYGDAPVRAYIAALPGWKQDVAARIDDIVPREVPCVVRAVKWNSPLYGVEKDLWFLNLHAFTAYMKVTFFRGALLDPEPPQRLKAEGVRALHILEGDDFETQLAVWVRQASQLPGERL
ncbi:hypothetical protein GCM10011360_01420 [Primorskyibacter flagellatus]|uniref:YdhG-like domain-containing protein n=1 Tax=Primorskyibacter flagellatus TaxID=1387277 RepID=A0A917E9J6_9RHOB|nr:DUF1801 domain-containing protein [Primorskyibacter flagellatus]GGE16396.1 hypothetical protein GCM10011360_01420 [Primorskyibacter flagellatus]